MTLIAPSAADVAQSYSTFGLHVRSEIPLPVATISTQLTPAWTIVRAAMWQRRPEPRGELVSETPCNLPCCGGAVISRAYRRPGYAWIWSRDSGVYDIDLDTRRVTVFADPGAEDRAIALVLLGQISIFLLHQLGYPSLHASAVLVDGGAVAFLGPAGTGKSTMASSFLRHGYTLLSDDVLPLEMCGDEVRARPGAPVMKVWSATATHTLGIDEELPDLTPSVSKKLLRIEERFAFSETSAPVRALYLLRRFSPEQAGTEAVSIRRLGQSQAFPALLSQSPRCEMLYPREAARLLPFYARLLVTTPVRVLAVPDGFDYQEQVRRAVLVDLEVER
ncbi:MAG: hypothetical protein JO023_27730 [Chloroflexi bacterium]|nr:hypothetical protein [Chloroflexota bacterium]